LLDDCAAADSENLAHSTINIANPFALFSVSTLLVSLRRTDS